AAQSPEPARLEALLQRFENAAYEFPCVDAAVVYRPDLRRDEAQRLFADPYYRPIELMDPGPESDVEQLAASPRITHDAVRFALELDGWIPAWDKSVEQLGLRVYWTRRIVEFVNRGADAPVNRELWQCTLFGPSSPEAEHTTIRLFNMLCSDAANLVLCGNG